MILYRVRDWDRHFENNKSRIIKDLKWVLVPNKMDGDGYTQLVDHKNGAAHFGAWTAIVEVASKCHPRGTLVREDGTPYTPDTLARVTRLPARVFEEVLPRLSSPRLGWLEALETADSEGHGTLVPDDGTLVPQSAANRSTNRRELNRTELKGREGGGERGGGRFTPPTLEEIQAYAEKTGAVLAEAKEFLDYWTRVGWRRPNGRRVRDWELTFDNHEKLLASQQRSKPSRVVNQDVIVGKGDQAPMTDEERARAIRFRFGEEAAEKYLRSVGPQVGGRF